MKKLSRRQFLTTAAAGAAAVSLGALPASASTPEANSQAGTELPWRYAERDAAATREAYECLRDIRLGVPWEPPPPQKFRGLAYHQPINVPKCSVDSYYMPPAEHIMFKRQITTTAPGFYASNSAQLLREARHVLERAEFRLVVDIHETLQQEYWSGKIGRVYQRGSERAQFMLTVPKLFASSSSGGLCPRNKCRMDWVTIQVQMELFIVNQIATDTLMLASDEARDYFADAMSPWKALEGARKNRAANVLYVGKAYRT